MTITLLGILAYIGLQLLLGVVVARRIRTEDDFLLAGRRLGYVLATFSIFATWFGAESCIGTAGAAYAEGLAGVTADPFGYTVCLLLMGLVFAMPLWKLRLTTIADFFRRRYSVSVERLTAVIMVPTSLLWAAAQIRAFGQVLTASSELQLTVAISVAALVVIIYTALGGLLADAITDIVQGVILISGLVFVFYSIMNDVGGIGAAMASIGSDKLSLIPDGSGSGPRTAFTIAEAWAIPIFGSVVAQEVISRVLASRSPQVAQRSSFMASAMYVCVGLMPLLIGLIGFSQIPNLDDPEHVLPMMAQIHLSKVFYVIFAGALVSAILSTVDSALLAASALLSHNVVISVRPDMPERRKLLIGRLGVVVMGAIAYLLALHAEGVYHLVKDASAFGSAGIFVVMIFGLFTKLGGVRSALATLTTGAAVWIVSYYFFEFEWSYLLSLLVALLAYLSVAFVEIARNYFVGRHRQPVTD